MACPAHPTTLHRLPIAADRATLVLDGGFSVGMLFAFIAYKQQFGSRIISFIEKGIGFRMLGLHTERIADIVLTEPEAEDSVELTTVCANIEVRKSQLSLC